ncbi:MAG: bifunctional DNA-formamidopyrimidine glycosylase/DNA-(apurinic or apyrimidinic site) lyase [Anaerolineales bacterium]|jgi:formamidopyrimidine-DNA glycosylase|nr:bifunctional DNA-formamidopyrimidine glycosylase/DNA-(apurinic or apyrimidinic site) lyase [Anaerolineales bacterium]
MPELPEVETITRSLRPALVGRQILSVGLFWPRSLAAPGIVEFHERILGQRIQEVRRRAKYIHLLLSDGHLLIHLRMSGDLLLRPAACAPEPHDRLHLELDSGQTLVFNDPRKFGRVWLLEQPEAVLGKLGPEPFSDHFNPGDFYKSLQTHSRQLKPLLLDQSFLAGLGNIYSDEALHLAGLHPLRQSDTISLKETHKLFEAIRLVLQTGIENNGASIDWVYRGGSFQNHFRVYGRTGQPCPVCETTIQRIVVGQRSTHVCPVCQPQE